MIKETITVMDTRELKKAVKKKYDTIVLDGEIKSTWMSKMDNFQFEKKGKSLSDAACAVGLVGSLFMGIGIPVLIGGLIGNVIFKDAIKHYELNYEAETNTMKLLYYKE